MSSVARRRYHRPQGGPSHFGLPTEVVQQGVVKDCEDRAGTACQQRQGFIESVPRSIGAPEEPQRKRGEGNEDQNVVVHGFGDVMLGPTILSEALFESPT